MADAASILRANGMGLADELVQAAALEGLAVPIAATLIAGESWGRNIWGHDTTVTAGTYTPGGPVAQANYLAYRTAMRAGRIKRNGAGPAQCTSAQYQDTADALGGCWDPVANMRSGFRGMGALMKAYGVRDGARRYNGSGAQAEAYAASFMTRLATWEARLAGASTGPAPSPTPARRPRLPGTEYLMEPITVAPWTDSTGKVHNSGRVKRTLPVGSRSACIAAAWLNFQAGGPADAKLSATIYPLADSGGSGPVWQGSAQNDDADHGQRTVYSVPDATTTVLIDWTVTGSPGAYGLITPELEPH